jgi:hypothetical protein
MYIWLLKTYAIPAGMYASQIWATPYLQQGKERALVTHLPYILPKYMFFNLLCDVIRSAASFRLRDHTLRL